MDFGDFEPQSPTGDSPGRLSAVVDEPGEQRLTGPYTKIRALAIVTTGLKRNHVFLLRPLKILDERFPSSIWNIYPDRCYNLHMGLPSRDITIRADLE